MKDANELKAIGARLCAARIASNLSLQDVGIAIKRNKGTVSKWERGINEPSAEALQQLAILYRTDDFVKEARA